MDKIVYLQPAEFLEHANVVPALMCHQPSCGSPLRYIPLVAGRIRVLTGEPEPANKKTTDEATMMLQRRRM